MKVPKAHRMPSGLWRIQLRLGGKSIPVTARTEKECIRLAQSAKAEILAGKRQITAEDAGQLPTLRDAIDNYLDARITALSPATIRGYEGIKRNRFQGIMDRSLSDLTRADYVAACKAEATKCSAKTLRNAWLFIRSVIKFATGQEAPEVPLPQVVPNERPFLDAEQIKVFLSAVRGNPYEIPLLLALSSMRCSEILALQWESVDLKHRRIRVKGAVVPDSSHRLIRKRENKNRSSTRNVPILMDQLHKALESAWQPSGAVVTCGPEALRRNALRICQRNGLPPVGLHGLRHSFASLAYHLNVPEQITMEIGGWSDIQTMRKIYTHISQSDMGRYEAAFSGFFGKNAHENAYG